MISPAVACALYVSDVCTAESANDQLEGDRIIPTGVV